VLLLSGAFGGGISSYGAGARGGRGDDGGAARDCPSRAHLVPQAKHLLRRLCVHRELRQRFRSFVPFQLVQHRADPRVVGVPDLVAVVVGTSGGACRVPPPEFLRAGPRARRPLGLVVILGERAAADGGTAIGPAASSAASSPRVVFVVVVIVVLLLEDGFQLCVRGSGSVDVRQQHHLLHPAHKVEHLHVAVVVDHLAEDDGFGGRRAVDTPLGTRVGTLRALLLLDDPGVPLVHGAPENLDAAADLEVGSGAALDAGNAGARSTRAAAAAASPRATGPAARARSPPAPGGSSAVAAGAATRALGQLPNLLGLASLVLARLVASLRDARVLRVFRLVLHEVVLVVRDEVVAHAGGLVGVGVVRQSGEHVPSPV